MDSVMFCIKPSDMGLLPFMNMAFFYDCTGKPIECKKQAFMLKIHIVMRTTLMKSAIFIVTYI